MTRKDVIQELRRKQGARTVGELAAEVGVSRPYLHEVLAGNRPPAKKVLTYLGITRERIVTLRYARKERG